MSDEDNLSDSDWVRSLIDAHAADLTRYAASILHDADAAKDVVQDVFVRLWREPRSNLQDHVLPWLFRVCRNRALDVRRKEARMERMNEVIESQTPSAGADPSARVETEDSHAHVRQLLEGLPENQREVVRLKFQNGMSYKEIATVTELTVTNVGYLIHTAIKSLRTEVLASGE